MKRAGFDLPLAPHFDEGALAALAASEGVRIGEANVQFFMASDWIGTLNGIPVRTGGCPGADTGALPTWRIEASPNDPREHGCMTVTVERARERLSLTVDTASSQTGRGILALELTLTNISTAAGRLFRDNPAQPVAADSTLSVVRCAGYGEGARCGEDGAVVRDTVREVVGGETSVSFAASKRRAVFGELVVFTGRVLRGGRPSSGERVFLSPHFRRGEPARSPAPGSEAVQGVTDADGRFRLARRLRGSARWSVRAQKPAGASAPRLNTLVGTSQRPLFVHAPRPPIEKRSTRRLRAGLTSAVIVVKNPLGRLATLTCVLRVGERQYTRRFPFTSTMLVFEVTARTGSRVVARVFQDHPAPQGGWISPLIAPGFSRAIRL